MQAENWHYRPLSFNTWRRCIANTRNVDIDSVEYCSSCGELLALMETCDQNSTDKATTILVRLARKAELPAYLVNYTKNCVSWKGCTIHSALVEQVYPERKDFGLLEADEVARWLIELHLNCPNTNCPGGSIPQWIDGCVSPWQPLKAVMNIVRHYAGQFIGVGGQILHWLKDLEDQHKPTQEADR